MRLIKKKTRDIFFLSSLRKDNEKPRKTRTKGRDLYDYIFFLANNTKVNLELVKNKLIESNYINSNDKFSIDDLKKLLINKFKGIDYIEAKEDVIPFIKNTESLNIWSSEFFISITEELTI